MASDFDPEDKYRYIWGSHSVNLACRPLLHTNPSLTISCEGRVIIVALTLCECVLQENEIYQYIIHIVYDLCY